MSSQIADTPKLEWPAGQRQVVSVPVTLSSGNVLTDFATFTLTVREDPGFPRTGASLNDNLDPHGDGWASAASASGTASGSTLTFVVTVPSSPGRKRYSLDVWAIGGTAGPVQLVNSTWLTVLPAVR